MIPFIARELCKVYWNLVLDLVDHTNELKIILGVIVADIIVGMLDCDFVRLLKIETKQILFLTLATVFIRNN